MRLENWPTLLNKFIDENRNRPFVWGEWDCGLAALEAVKVITGVDHTPKFKGRYEPDAISALLFLRREFGGFYEAVVDTFGQPIENHKFVRAGDLVMKDTDLGPALGFNIGTMCAFTAEPKGWAFVQVDNPIAVWSIN